MIEVLTLLIAIAGGLDLVAPKEWKASFLSLMSRLSPKSGSGLNVTTLVDRLFGDRIVSIRAVTASAILTAGSIVVMFCIALVSNSAVIVDFGRSLRSAGQFGFYALTIAVIFTLIGDFFSYAKTRLFIRIIASNRSTSTTGVVLLADFFASITIFCLFFALGRMLIYVLLGLFVAEPIKQEYRIAPTVIARAATTIGLDVLVKNADDTLIAAHPEIGVVQAAMAFSADETASAKRIAELSSRSQPGALDANLNFVSQTHEVTCYDSMRVLDIAAYEAFDAYLHSIVYLVLASGKVPDKSVVKNTDWQKLEASVKEAISHELLEGPPGCRLKLVSIHQTISVPHMFGHLSPIDLYLSALSFSLAQSFDALPSKFVIYSAPELNEELPRYLARTWHTHALGFLSNKGPDKLSLHIASQLDDMRFETRPKLAPIPLSTLLSSSLGASILLWIVLAIEKVAKFSLLLKTVVSNSFSAAAVRKGVFSFVALTIALAVLIFAALIYITSVLWRAMFGALT